MRIFKKILLALFVVFVLLQFIPKSVNKSNKVLLTDISKKYSIPAEVQSILKRACYDCHSNNTNYPWYASIQPFRLMLDRHIKNGKQDLNFSEFSSYSEKRQYNKLNSIGESLKKETMPLESYKVMHRAARLNKAEKDTVIKWINETREFMKSKNQVNGASS
jgi:hypothetical protein